MARWEIAKNADESLQKLTSPKRAPGREVDNLPVKVYDTLAEAVEDFGGDEQAKEAIQNYRFTQSLNNGRVRLSKGGTDEECREAMKTWKFGERTRSGGSQKDMVAFGKKAKELLTSMKPGESVSVESLQALLAEALASK